MARKGKAMAESNEIKFSFNDVVMRPVTIRVINEAKGLDAPMRLDRNIYDLEDEITMGERITAMRGRNRDVAYARELREIVTGILAKSDPTWTPEMVGKLWEGVCWTVLGFFAPLTPSVAAPPNESGETEKPETTGDSASTSVPESTPETVAA